MYISIARNAKGNLEIDDNVINQMVEYLVQNHIEGYKEIKVSSGIHNENNIFITINLKVKEREEFQTNFDMIALSEQINDAINNSIGIRPKSVSFAYLH